jgi:hypothetical protein
MPQQLKVFDEVYTPAQCAKVIERFDRDARVQPDPQPDYSTRRYLNASHCADWMGLNTEFCRLVNELTTAYFARPPELALGTHHEWSDDGYVIARYGPGDACILHVDGQCAVAPQNGLRLATLVLYLNDVPRGGETWFPLQNIKVKPERGKAIMFPVGFTHPHEVLPTETVRYVMQTWITDPNLAVVPIA